MQSIQGVSVPFSLTPESETGQKRINAGVVAWTTEAGAIESATASLSGVADDDFCHEHVEVAAELAKRRLALVKNEIALRKEIDDLYARVNQHDWPIARRAAQAALEDAKADVHAKLLAIGFVEPAAATLTTHAIPGVDDSVVFMHPTVRHLAQKRDALATNAVADAKVLNLRGLESAKQKLADHKAKALRSIA